MKYNVLVGLVSLSIFFIGDLVAQITLVDSFSSNQSRRYPILEGVNGEVLYYEVDSGSLGITVRNLDNDILAQFRPFANIEFIATTEVIALKPSEWSSSEPEYFVSVDSFRQGTLSPIATDLGSPHAGIYTSSGRVVKECRGFSTFLRLKNGTTLIRRSMGDSTQFINLPNLTSMAVLPGSVLYRSLGDGEGFYSEIRATDSTEASLTRYNDDLSLRYSISGSARMISGTTRSDKIDNILISKDSILNGDSLRYVSIIDSSSTVKYDTFLPSARAVGPRYGGKNFLTLVGYADQQQFIHIDRETLTNIDFPNASATSAIVNNRECVYFLEAEVNGQIPVYDALTYDSLFSIPMVITHNNIEYDFHQAIRPGEDMSFGGASYVYKRSTNDGDEVIFLDDQYQKVEILQTDGLVRYYIYLAETAYCIVAKPDWNGRIHDYIIYELDAMSSSVTDIFVNTVQLYPNPASNWFSISSDNNEVSSIRLLNSLGHLIGSWNNVSTDELIEIDLPNGLYSVIVNTKSNSIETGKLLVR